MKHICIVGGGGFIGRHLVGRLAGKDRRISVIGRNPLSPFEKSINYLAADPGDPDFLKNALRDVDEVIEMAYSTTPQTSFQDPIKDIFENLSVSVKLFETLINTNVQKVLYVSSGGTIYGQATDSPIVEQHPTDPVSPYGITKLAIEKYGRMYHFTNGLPIVIVRPANAYGEGQFPFRGQGFISTAIATVLNGQKVKIFGKEGTVRDYIYVEDIASGIVAALEHGVIGECYNIGTGTGRTNLEIIKILEPLLKSAGFDAEYELFPPRAFDVKLNILDSAKLSSISGWRPYTELKEGLGKTLEWLIANKE